MPNAYIYDHVRTPRGRGRESGSLHEVTPISLITEVLKALSNRNEFDTKLVDDVILGCVTPIGEQGANIARIAVINADYAESVPGKQINRFCSSGLEAVSAGAAQIMAGQAELVIGGGVESMSRVPMASDGGAWGCDPSIATKMYFIPQGISADLLATKFGIAREDVDRYGLASQQRATAAWDHGYFSRSVIVIADQIGQIVLDRDENIRPDTTLVDLARLEPSFSALGERYGFDAVAQQRYPEIEFINHVHHAGNSSVIADGAAGVLVGSKGIGEQLGMRPRARIRAFASVGSEPTIMLTGPAPSAEKALHLAGMSKGDIDLFEVNEAFAAVPLSFMATMDVDHGKVNVNGGAIAMGHPLGATGAMILGTALDELERRAQGVALITLCVGAGMGTTMIIERI